MIDKSKAENVIITILEELKRSVGDSLEGKSFEEALKALKSEGNLYIGLVKVQRKLNAFLEIGSKSLMNLDSENLFRSFVKDFLEIRDLYQKGQIGKETLYVILNIVLKSSNGRGLVLVSNPSLSLSEEDRFLPNILLVLDQSKNLDEENITIFLKSFIEDLREKLIQEKITK